MQIQLPIVKTLKRIIKRDFIEELSNEIIKIETIINNLKSSNININIEQEEKALETLKEDIKQKIQAYQEMTDKLLKIEKQLKNYEKLNLIMNKALYLENGMKSEEAEKNITEFRKISLEILEEMKQAKANILTDNQKIYKRIYKIIYEFIKYEIINELESETLKHLKNNIELHYINQCIKKNIESIKKEAFIEDPRLIDKLNMYINKSMSVDLTSTLINKNIIFTIVLIENGKKIEQSLKKRMNHIENEFSKNLETMKEYINEELEDEREIKDHEKDAEITKENKSPKPKGSINRLKLEIEEQKEKLRKIRKSMKNKATLLVLSIMLVSGVAVTGPNIAKEDFTKYVTVTEIYENGKEPKKLTSYEHKTNGFNRELRIYGQYYYGDKNYEAYDLSDIIIEDGTTEDYLNIDIKTFNLKPSQTNYETVEDREIERKLTIKTQNPNTALFDEEEYKNLMIWIYLVIALITSLPITFGIKLIKLIKEEGLKERFSYEQQELLQELVKKCKKYIKANETLAKEYYEIYNGELQKLSKEELEDKISELIKENEGYKKTLKSND